MKIRVKQIGLSCSLALTLQLGLSSHALCAEPPAVAARYQGKLFELIEPGEAKYDADFSKRFDSVLAPYARVHRNFRKRITSGAAGNSTAVVIKGRNYLHFASCQAHQCDSTTVDLLFDPTSKRMVAKILDRCEVVWLGEPDSAEQAMLDAQHRENFPAVAQHCGTLQ